LLIESASPVLDEIWQPDDALGCLMDLTEHNMLPRWRAGKVATLRNCRRDHQPAASRRRRDTGRCRAYRLDSDRPP